MSFQIRAFVHPSPSHHDVCHDVWLEALPQRGFVWVTMTRAYLHDHLTTIQHHLLRLTGQTIQPLHWSDLMNAKMPSTFEDTSGYDMLIFRGLSQEKQPTQAIGFLIFDHLLVSIHPEPDPLWQAPHPQAQSSGDLMLCLIEAYINPYLALRQTLTQQAEHWQHWFISSHQAVSWSAFMRMRTELHQISDWCEDHLATLQGWLNAQQTQDLLRDPTLALEQTLTAISVTAWQDLIKTRTRNAIEHIERVAQRVRRLEQNIETALQIHFSMQSQRTNDIMRILTVITAVFLPLNLMAGIFGMNFEFIPIVHQKQGFWMILSFMLFTALGMIWVFWRKRYLARTQRIASTII